MICQHHCTNEFPSFSFSSLLLLFYYYNCHSFERENDTWLAACCFDCIFFSSLLLLLYRLSLAHKLCPRIPIRAYRLRCCFIGPLVPIIPTYWYRPPPSLRRLPAEWINKKTRDWNVNLFRCLMPCDYIRRLHLSLFYSSRQTIGNSRCYLFLPSPSKGVKGEKKQTHRRWRVSRGVSNSMP